MDERDRMNERRPETVSFACRVFALMLMCILGFGKKLIRSLLVPNKSSFHPSKFSFCFSAMNAQFLTTIFLGSYFCFDNPAALQDYFKHDMQLTTTEFVYLYSWYSWPNVILCFVGGFLIDR
jgi:hypothetical protein